MRTFLFVVFALAILPARADIGEGSWELEVTTLTPGAPAHNLKQVQCMSADDAKDPTNLIGSPGVGCAFISRRDDGSRFRFEISCGAGAPLSGAGEIQYTRDTLDGEIVVRVKQGEQTMEVRSVLKARRLGPCR
jgi:hypothetical protein